MNTTDRIKSEGDLFMPVLGDGINVETVIKHFAPTNRLTVQEHPPLLSIKTLESYAYYITLHLVLRNSARHFYCKKLHSIL